MEEEVLCHQVEPQRPGCGVSPLDPAMDSPCETALSVKGSKVAVCAEAPAVDQAHQTGAGQRVCRPLLRVG